MKNEIYIFLRGSVLMLLLIAGVSLRVYAQPCPTAPTISGMTFSPADPCLNQNHSIVNVTIAPSTPGTGYEYRYSLDGSPSFANSLPGGIPVGPHCITVAVFATTNVVCDGNNYGPGVMIPGTSVTYTLYFGTAGPPAIPRASIIGNLTCAPTISVVPDPLYSCYTYEYSIDGGPYSSTIPASLSRGCHTISYQLVSNAAGHFGCGFGSPTPASGTTDFSLFDDLFNIPNASLSVNRTCSDGTNGVVTSISGLPPASPGLTYEYSFNMQPYTTSLPTNLAPGCYNIMIRQVADCPGTTGDGTSPPECRKDINFVVFPTPPVITAPSNTCDAMFALPSVTPVPGFVVQYSIDGGAWETSPSTTTPGCHSVRARYVTATPCGSLPFNIVPAESFSDGVVSACTDASNSVEVVIFPAAPVITAPANTCASAFTLPTVPAVAGFTVQYSINGGTWTASPIVPTTPGCYNVRARYVLSAVCGATAANTPGFGACAASNTVNVVIFPTAPIITSPTNTCNAPFTLPAVPAIAGFTVEYRIDNTTAGTTGTFSTSPTIPSAAACYAVTARYVLAADCGTAPENVIAAGTPGMGACANSNTVNVVVFPAAPTLTQPASTCNAMFTLPSAPAVDGFVLEYELDGSGSWSASPSTTVAGCHTVRARYALAEACGGTPAGATSADAACAASAPVSALIYPTAPVITAPANTCDAAFTLPAVPPFAGFTVEYRIENTSTGSLIDWTSTPVVPTTAGCYAIQARYVNTAACGTVAAGTPGTGACGASNLVNVVIFPPASSIFWDLGGTQTATTLCGNAFPSFIFVASGAIFPPVFDFQLSLDNGATWLPVNTYPDNTSGPGCYRVVLRWVLAEDCGSTLAGTAGPGACAVSNTLDLLNVPDAPVITAPANTCASMFTLPDVTPIPGFDVEYSLDDGTTWSANPTTTDAGCYSVRARYVSANACGTIPAGTAGPAPCNQSNAVQVVIFPAVTATPGPVTKGATCGTTNVTFTWSGPAPAATITQNGATFELRYSIDGGAFSNTSGTFTGVAPGCHTIEARYVLTTACGATAAGTAAPANCGVQREFIIWLNLDGVPLTVDLVENCGATTNISSITLGGAPSVPAGQELVYVYRINGGPLNGPVTLAQLQAVDFPPGCHQVRVRVRATVNCGVGPDGAIAGAVAPNACQSNVRNFVTFPEPPSITVDPICDSGDLVVTPDILPPAGFQWRFRLINTTTGTEVVVNNWQASSTFTAVPVGCYRVEAVPVRTDICGQMDPSLAGYEPGAVYPSNIHRPLNNQTAASLMLILRNLMRLCFFCGCICSSCTTYGYHS
ncbi:MAG: hypothetical protein IPM26_04610 [Saprospiraceae bacterium]|nr:hypothetical protein [Saprospiraceae bacterium]